MRRAGDAIVVLPSSWALSDLESSELSKLVSDRTSGSPANRGILFDGTPGVFDEHGTLRASTVFESMLPGFASDAPRTVCVKADGSSKTWPGEVEKYASDRLARSPSLDLPLWIGQVLSPLVPEVQVPLETRTRVHRFHARGAELVALERNINYHMSEHLRQAGGNQALEQPITTEVRLRRKYHVYDLRRQKHLGYTNQIQVQLDPWKPSLLALSLEEIPRGEDHCSDYSGALRRETPQPWSARLLLRGRTATFLRLR